MANRKRTAKSGRLPVGSGKTTKRRAKPAAKPAEPSPAFALLDRLERHAIDAVAAYEALGHGGMVIVPDLPSSLFGIIGKIRTLRLTLRYDLSDKSEVRS